MCLSTIGWLELDTLTSTFHIYFSGSSVRYYLLQAMQCDDHKWVGHCEYHPNVNHLDIASHGQRVRYGHKTKWKSYQ